MSVVRDDGSILTVAAAGIIAVVCVNASSSVVAGSTSTVPAGS